MKRTSSPRTERRRAGTWLKRLREDAELTQLDVANRVGFKYYAFVSQVETGFSRLPTEKMEAWARTLRVDPQQFARHLLSFYEPELHRMLYETESRERDADVRGVRQ